MKRKIIIFVTLLFVALAINGFAHNRHHREGKREQAKCICEKQRPQMNRENFDGKRHQNRPFKDTKFQNRRMNRPERKNSVTVVKDTINGKTAMVTVESPLNMFQLAHLQLLN